MIPFSRVRRTAPPIRVTRLLSSAVTADGQTGRSNVCKAGDFIIEAIGQWHQAVNLDDRPLKLLVIDQQADEKSNVVMRK
jgi:quercetin dioxygenase-like cupin family protein